jgi:hypothetical protein
VVRVASGADRFARSSHRANASATPLSKAVPTNAASRPLLAGSVCSRTEEIHPQFAYGCLARLLQPEVEALNLSAVFQLLTDRRQMDVGPAA